MHTETYNGYFNRETWALVLHMDNTYGLVDAIFEEIGPDWKHTLYLEQMLENIWTKYLSEDYWYEEFGSPTPEWAKFARTDIGSLWRVEWSEVAEAFLETLRAEGHTFTLGSK